MAGGGRSEPGVHREQEARHHGRWNRLLSRLSVCHEADLGLVGKVTIGLLVLLGLGALAGGVALLFRPDGSVMGFDVALLAGSPFPDYVIPG